MKIVSNYKDYYDFLQGIYGIDEKIVYERVCGTKNTKGDIVKSGVYKPHHIEIKDSPEIKFYILAICGIIYYVAVFENRFYFGDNALLIKFKSLDAEMDKKNMAVVKSMFNLRNPEAGEVVENHLSKTNINEKENCPVILVKRDRWNIDNYDIIVFNPKLSDFGIGQVISPEAIYVMISNFLSREKTIVDNRTNIEKIITHGFDKKTSFRNM